MTLILAGQLAGIAFACGINLYLTVAVLGILSRFDILTTLPGLQGLEGTLVISSALALYFVEAVVDKISHADSLWDTVHTFIRPPAAALLAVAALWGLPAGVMAAGALFTFLVALAAHTIKAGLRLALNATMRTRWQTRISVAEDVLAVAFAVSALRVPVHTLAAVGAALLLSALFAPRLTRAFHLGTRAVAAWLRSIFVPPRWRELQEMPRTVRDLLDDTPLAAAPPRGTRAAIHGLKGTGAFRNGWLVLTVHGPTFIYRTLFRHRRIELPAPREIRLEPGVWADILRIHGDGDVEYTLFIFKDGPEIELAIQHLNHATV